MMRFWTVVMALMLIFQPVLRAEEKISAEATAAAGKALKAVSDSEEVEEDLDLDDLGIGDEIGMEEGLEEDEFDENDKTESIGVEELQTSTR